MVLQASCSASSGVSTSSELCPDKCICSLLNETGDQYGADCSSRSLTIFPSFPRNIIEINLSYNNFDIIRVSNSSQIPSEVRSLDLSYCGVKEIDRGFLRSFVKLEFLDISYNRELTLEVLPNVTHDLQFTSIRTLKFDALHCVAGDPNMLRLRHLCHLRNTSIEELHLSSNRINQLERHVIATLPDTIKFLTAADNRIEIGWYALEISSVKNIMFVNLSSQYTSYANYLTMFQPLCNDGGNIPKAAEDCSCCNYQESPTGMTTTSISTSCLEEYHQKHTTDRITIYICVPRSLKTLIFDHSSIRPTHVMNFTFLDFRSIQKYDYNGNLAEFLKREIFGSDLTYADYSKNYISYIYPHYFHDANLTHLNLSNNYLGEQIEKEGHLDVLKNQRFLTYISLARNRISSIPSTLFDNLLYLEHLDLSGNSIQSITFDLSKLRSLQFLNLQNNRINFLTNENMRQLHDKREKVLVVDLEENVLLCSCETLQFLKWIQEHRNDGMLSFRGFKNYTCSLPNSTRMGFSELPRIILEMERKCPSYVGVIVGSMVAITVFLVSLAAGMTYRMRWRLRYLYYMAKRAYTQNAIARSMHNENYHKIFRYDAFISYSTDDRSFALHDMIREVENKTELKLCFHERDFVPGYDIAENIVNAIHDSRKVICVISDSFISSHWCMYEFNMALMERIHGRESEDMLILVLMKATDFQKVPSSMFEFIRSNSYLELPDDDSCVSMFWDKLIQTLSLYHMDQ